MFIVNASDKIAIRKLLTPKVMVDLVDKATEMDKEQFGANFPNLSINQENLVSALISYSILNAKKPCPKGSLTKTKLNNKKQF